MLRKHAPQLRLHDTPESQLPALDEPHAQRIAQFDWAAAERRRNALDGEAGRSAEGQLRCSGPSSSTGKSGDPPVASLAERFRCAKHACQHMPPQQRRSACISCWPSRHGRA
jgi:hypothetical protein